MRFLVIFLVFFLIPTAAFAYIDPATGAMFINGIAIAAVTIFAFFRRHITRLLCFLGIKKKPPVEKIKTEDNTNVDQD